MSDLISREYAIDIVRFECGEWRGLAKTIENGLSNLPSAGQYTDDEIQRMQDIEQAQIEKAYDLGYAEGKADEVPVVRCKDCKYWHREIYNGVEYFNFSSCDLNHHGDGNNFYCADAERKES